MEKTLGLFYHLYPFLPLATPQGYLSQPFIVITGALRFLEGKTLQIVETRRNF